MARRKLPDAACRNAKPKDRIYYVSDTEVTGLRLCVRPTGSKLWMLRYTFAGKESTHGLGTYPETGLEEARRKASDARKLIAEGIHPTTARRVRKAQNQEAGAATFKVVADEWLLRNKRDWSGHHYERNEGLLRLILFPDLGSLPVAQITESMQLVALRKAYDGGIRESARRARAVAAQVFQYAKDTRRAAHNPARELAGSSLLKRPPVKHFAALKATEVGPMLRALGQSSIEPRTRAALMLMLLTGLRDATLRGAKWSELDLTALVWTVPGARMKSGREHRVPLPSQAAAILTQLAKLTRSSPDAYVFASDSKAGYLAENTLRAALHALGFKVTAHGFRSLITDLLNERGFNPDAIERQLDHVEKNQVRAAYLRTDYFDYRRDMMQWLADWADAQCAERALPELPSNVVELRRVA